MKAQLEDAVARSLVKDDEMVELDVKAEPADPRPADPHWKAQADPELVVKKDDAKLELNIGQDLPKSLAGPRLFKAPPPAPKLMDPCLAGPR